MTTPTQRWIRPLLWSLLLLNLAAGLLLPPWLDDDVRRRIAASGVLRVGLDPAYPPFENDIHGELLGYDIDLARRLGEELGLEVRFVPMAYDALYDALIAGQIDLILSSYPYSPQLCQRERCTRRYFQAGQVLVVRRDSGITRHQDLDQMQAAVAVVWGSPGDLLLRDWQRGIGMIASVPFMNPQEALAALHAGEVDAAIVDRISALSYTSQEERILEPPLQEEYFVGVVAHQAIWLRQQLNRSLRRLERAGYLAELEAQWCQPQWLR